MSEPKPDAVKLYFDYLCPYAWRGLELARMLSERSGMHFELRHYSLEQGNHTQNAAGRSEPLWKLVEQPDNTRSLPQFLASQAAKLQGEELFFRFALELFRLRHREKAEFDAQTLSLAAQRAGLDLERFQADLGDTDIRRRELAEDLDTADQLGVFGTPTFELESGHAAYFRFAELVQDPQKALELWQQYTTLLESPHGIETVKRAKRALRPAQ